MNLNRTVPKLRVYSLIPTWADQMMMNHYHSTKMNHSDPKRYEVDIVDGGLYVLYEREDACETECIYAMLRQPLGPGLHHHINHHIIGIPKRIGVESDKNTYAYDIRRVKEDYLVEMISHHFLKKDQSICPEAIKFRGKK